MPVEAGARNSGCSADQSPHPVLFPTKDALSNPVHLTERPRQYAPAADRVSHGVAYHTAADGKD